MLVRYLAVGVAILLGARGAGAQQGAAAPQSGPGAAAEHIALGDSAHAQMKAVEALAHYREALAADSTNYGALWRASREAVALGEFEPDPSKQKADYADAERWARAAVAADSNDAEGHFELAQALGRVALSLGKKERVRYAKEVRAEALTALAHDSTHAGALHVLGRWNAEIMRLSGFSRFFAKKFLGGDVLGKASWDSAVVYMEKSVAHDPTRLVHHLDLGEIYRDRDRPGDREKAREQLELVVNGQATEYDDPFYKKEAQADLAKLK